MSAMMQTEAMSQTEARNAFEAALRAHRGIVLKVAHNYASLPEDRADLAQEIAAQLWRAFPGYDPGRSLSTWMYRIALNVAISFVRQHGQRSRQHVPIGDEHADLAATTFDHESAQQVERLRQFIAAQPPMDRALLLLYLEERPQREIGEILGLSETHVSTKIGRLKQRIRTEL